MKSNKQTIVRDLSWLAFNERVLQEAKDPSVHLHDRLRFLGIFSNNLDEFFRVRVATLNKMIRLGKAAKVHMEANPEKILRQIQETVISQQTSFDETYEDIIREMEKGGIFMKNEKQLSRKQKEFIKIYFDEKVRTQIVPLMIESIPQMPLLRDKSIYLACVLGNTSNPMLQRYALIEIPTKVLPRFVILPPDGDNEKDIILLEDIIRFNLPYLFAPFGFNRFLSYIIKVTRDAELEIENEVSTNVITELEKGLKNRKKGRATRFIYDRSIDPGLLDYLIKRLTLTKKDNLIAGGRIHNFKDFMSFPSSVFQDFHPRPRAFVHPLLQQPCRIMEVLEQRDVMLHMPYHSFDSVIDLLREAAIDPFVQSIKITCYRLAKDSKIVNALINAVRNGKQVTVMLELRARFDEEANLMWKERLEEEGVKVVLGVPDMKVHAKLCVIKKREFNKTKQYGFVSTGNLNENTAQYYGDHCLLTTNRNILADINRIFNFLENPTPKFDAMRQCRTLPVAPLNMRRHFMMQIDKEIKNARKKKKAFIILKMNSLVDPELINKIYEAARAGVKIKLIVRGICGAITQQKSFKNNIEAISIIDEYLEHARVFVFHNDGKPLVYISSADWMVRNLDHRVEAATPIYDKEIQQELMDILNIQLAENVKGRILDNEQKNAYVQRHEHEAEVRSQIAIYDYLLSKQYKH
ncbi:polyphosphate kinase 1 [Taibaiella soli]|uniref:polyphosphate kinase 1 n=1 Tax=Taibaiella soli TaxID=1649169 RepID=UPI001FB20F56|nr:polyphosphate kinase 1 [Taibaiella soli]